MSIFITGDLHGATYIDKLRIFAESHGHELSRDDFVIILGDLCVPWNDPPSERDLFTMGELEGFPWTTLFIDGNHENFDVLNDLPERDWRGGRVHMLSEHVLHLMRGYVFDIEGRSFFAMGGAPSVNHPALVEGVSWWPQEIPNDRERERALATLEARDWQVDYVLSHCPPSKQLREYFEIYGANFTPDPYNVWLQTEIADRARFTQWFFGHMHDDRPWEPKFVALMHKIYDLDGRFTYEYWGPNNPIDEYYDEW